MIIKPAINYLVEHSNLILPYGVMPGTVDTGIREKFTKNNGKYMNGIPIL